MCLGITPGACWQQTPGLRQERTMKYNLNRFKTTGTQRGTDAVEAPAPHQIGTLAGASARATAANHARTASTKPNDGGGQHVRV